MTQGLVKIKRANAKLTQAVRTTPGSDDMVVNEPKVILVEVRILGQHKELGRLE